ncbi:hypothetical protein F4819DRAFT_221251 [Hypoxylon fuscum]|nr:hypothetical protein F4819DRAFT_221251 [Hypoxylon fuscum]
MMMCLVDSSLGHELASDERKRKYNCDSIENNGVNKRPRLLDNASSQASCGGSSSLLACPFSIACQSQLQASKVCIRRGFRNISRVKEHIRRCHISSNLKCQRCHQTFVHTADLEDHVRQQICQFMPSNPIIEGISQATMCEIKSRKRTCGPSETDKWYQIWNILFPNYQQPKSPYISPPGGFDKLQSFLFEIQHYTTLPFLEMLRALFLKVYNG